MRYPPGSRIDRFEVLKELGEGAYAETYLARDPASDILVVIKSPNPTLFADPGLFQRYRREATIARTLDHPGVQRALDDADDHDEPYLVLEYVDGENLRQRLQHFAETDGQVPVAVACTWGRQLADTLAYLHTKGVVHRDLKPENILVTTDDQLKVADFGTALLDGAKRLTWKHLSDSMGTPDYMSPEQIQGERGDDRSDIYGWGIIMYELLTGRVPFRGDNWMATMAGHLTKAPTPIRGGRPEIPPALEAVVLKAMRRYPEHRYQSAQDLVSDLDALDTLDPSTIDLSPEPPMGGMATADSTKRLWLQAVLIGVGFLAVATAIVLASVLL
jgi:serine/threonine protein kinase